MLFPSLEQNEGRSSLKPGRTPHFENPSPFSHLHDSDVSALFCWAASAVLDVKAGTVSVFGVFTVGDDKLEPAARQPLPLRGGAR